MNARFQPEIQNGVLLSRLGQVHRATGHQTPCGETVTAGRAAPVSNVQAVVHKLPLCTFCYPDHHRHHGGRHAR